MNMDDVKIRYKAAPSLPKWSNKRVHITGVVPPNSALPKFQPNAIPEYLIAGGNELMA